MTELNITKGEWGLYDARNKYYIDRVEGRDYEATMQKCYYIGALKPFEDLDTSTFVADIIVDARKIANARLMVEAGNVANETGLMPRELLEQRDLAIKALEDISKLSFASNWLSRSTEELGDILDEAEQAIASVKGGK